NYILHCNLIVPFYNVFNQLVVKVSLKPVSKYSKESITKQMNFITEKLIQPWLILWRLYSGHLKLIYPPKHQKHLFTSLSDETRTRLYLIWALIELLFKYLMAFNIIIVIFSVIFIAIPQVQTQWTPILLATIDFTALFII